MKISSIRANNGMLNLAELDDDAKFIDALGLDLQNPGNLEIVTDIVMAQLDAFQPQANFSGMSGLILDPNFSLKVFSERQIEGMGLALTLDEPQAEHDPLALPKLIGDWGVEQIRNNYAVAALTLYYHPGEELALKKKQFLAEIYDYCHYEEIELVVKLVVYTPGDEKFEWENFRRAQLQALEELRDLAHLFVLQYPHDSLACATITTQLDVPWVISNTNLEYDEFKDNLRDALENGASGFMVGESLFKEIEGLRHSDHSPDLENIKKFMQTRLRDRALELVRITQEFSQVLKET